MELSATMTEYRTAYQLPGTTTNQNTENEVFWEKYISYNLYFPWLVDDYPFPCLGFFLKKQFQIYPIYLTIWINNQKLFTDWSRKGYLCTEHFATNSSYKMHWSPLAMPGLLQRTWRELRCYQEQACRAGSIWNKWTHAFGSVIKPFVIIPSSALQGAHTIVPKTEHKSCRDLSDSIL